MKKNVYIHIGSPKTATSSIQTYLSNCQEILKENNILYPSGCSSHNAHHALCTDINREFGNQIKSFWYGDNIKPGTAWDIFSHELETSSEENIIISSELFFVLSEKGHRIIADRLKNHNVKIICFFRSQDELFNSFFNQDVKGNRQWSKSSYEFYETHILFMQSYKDRIELLEKVYGKPNTLILPFNPKEKSPIKVMTEILGVSSNDDIVEESQENSGIGPVSLYIKGVLNKLEPNVDKNEIYNEFISNAIGDIDKYNKKIRYVNNHYYNLHYTSWIKDLNYLKENFNTFKGAKKITPPSQCIPFEIDEVVLNIFVKKSLKALFSFNLKIRRKLLIKLILFILIENRIPWFGKNNEK